MIVTTAKLALIIFLIAKGILTLRGAELLGSTAEGGWESGGIYYCKAQKGYALLSLFFVYAATPATIRPIDSQS
ncbi:MAG: hypothetical protein Fur0021_05520 [Candidatus Promineifilaceae bacterium]